MPTTYTAIAKNVLTSGVVSFSFDSIPQTYTVLLLLVSAQTNAGSMGATIDVRINGTTTSYSSVRFYSDGSTVTSNLPSGFQFNTGFIGSTVGTANTFGSAEMYIPNYTGSTNKLASATAVAENNSTTAGASYITATASLRSNTDAITSLTIRGGGGWTIQSGSRFDLYGIKNS